MSTSYSVSLSLSDDNKQDSATTNAHRKLLIEMLKEQKVMTSTLSTIWGITMVAQINIDVPHHYTLYQFCPNVTQL